MEPNPVVKNFHRLKRALPGRLTIGIVSTLDQFLDLKFGECLPPPIAGEVFAARFNDPEAIANIRREPIRVVVVRVGACNP